MSEEIKSERFGCKLRRLREQKGLNQSELAKRSGVGRTTIVQVENGKREGLSIPSLILLARALDISLDEFTSNIHFGGSCPFP